MNKVTRIGLDLAKDVFQVHAVDAGEQVVVRKKIRRSELLRFFATLDREDDCVVGMEACGGAHHWSRELEKLGYRPRMMNARFVKAYGKGDKTDARDAEAICEAVSRPTMRAVPVRTLEQQDLLMLHRVREQVIKQRTALVNQTRGLLAEYGLVVGKRIEVLRKKLPELLEDAGNGLTVSAREVFRALCDELGHHDRRVSEIDRQLEVKARSDAACRRLMRIEGVGPIGATTAVAKLGTATQFSSGRECAAYLGLTPRQHSSGGKEKLLGISKRGDRYLRTVLVHGARAALRVMKGRTDARSRWAVALSERRHTNIAVVALAAKNARIIWALLSRGEEYQPAV
jgi:transposase